MDIIKTAEEIKKHKDEIMKGSRVKTVFKSKVVVVYSLVIIATFISYMYLLLCGEVFTILSIGDFIAISAMFFSCLFSLAQILFGELSKIPNLNYACKIHKSSLENLSENINQLTKECYLKHDIKIKSVQISEINGASFLFITF